jgi:hypothetical protein
MCASPLRYGRIAMFGGEDLSVTAANAYADFAGTASYAV